MGQILIFRAGFLGDLLLSTSTLRGIKQKHPDCKLSYGTWRVNAELLALNPHVDEVVFAGRYHISDFDQWLDIRHENLMGDYPSEYWGKLHAMQAAEKGLLDLERMDSYKPEFYIGPSDTARKKTGKLCVINCWSQNGLGWRLWDIDRWVELVLALKEMGFKVLHIGARDDPEIPGCEDMRGKTRLSQVAGILAVADLAICIDSFVAHACHSKKFVHDVETGEVKQIADSTPTVLLAGPISPSCVVPSDAKCISVSAYPDCDGPCGISHPGTPAGRMCKHGNSCMKKLPVHAVLKAVEFVRAGKAGQLESIVLKGAVE